MPRKLARGAGRRALAAVGAAVLGLSGCVSEPVPWGHRPHWKDPLYSFGFHNATIRRLEEVHIDYTLNGVAMTAGAGLLPPGPGGARYSFGPDPIPPQVTATWRDDQGTHHQVVAVASKVADPKNFSGTIWFRFLPDESVDVVPLTEDEMNQRVMRGGNYVPN